MCDEAAEGLTMAWAWMYVVLEIYTRPCDAQPVAAWMQARQTMARGVVSMRAWGLGCMGAARTRLDDGRHDQRTAQYRCG